MPAYDTEESLARRGANGAGAPRSEDYVFDAWTPLAFKRTLSGRAGIAGWAAPTWVGEHARRLQAYRILQAYVDNAARLFLIENDPEKLNSHREYGDAALIRNTIVAALLGDEQLVVVPGAEAFSDEEGSTNDAETVRAKELQDWLRAWGDKERLTRKVLETERDAVGLADGVYSLGFNPRSGRVRLRLWDPGFYFPVLTAEDDDFPSTVHIAWEEKDETQPAKTKIRRITWRLVDDPSQPAVTHPWNDGPTTMRCLMSDAEWLLDESRPATVEDLAQSSATYKTWVDPESGEELPFKDVYIGVDFIPVVHLPNTVSEKNHFGQSSIATVLQILDDIANADTDLQRAAATTGFPPIALSGIGAGSGSQSVGYKPGQVWRIGEGKLDVVDTSKSLDALLKLVQALLQRLHVNSRVPEAVVGRVDASDVPSGVALALSFGPLKSMVFEMRLVRDEKYPLLLKFAQRMSQAYGVKGVPEIWDLEPTIAFGSYLPADKDAVAKQVAELLKNGVISRETAVQMLIEAGFPIEDAVAEVRRIEEEDFDGAGKLFDATGNPEEVAKYLGRRALPQAPLPPASGDGGDAPPEALRS